MYIVYCQNKPKSEHIVSEYIDTYFEVHFGSYSLIVVILEHNWHNNISFYICSGPKAAFRPQAADHRPANQACPAYNEVPITAKSECIMQDNKLDLSKLNALICFYHFHRIF